ncbi:MAG: hypothetical protein J6Y78_04355 [Paludibacteraceae bacterium]|nr:hypothetical protein [Paludibacteraceae bacterium]
MIEIDFKYETKAFEEWLFNLHHRFQQMVQTLIDVHNLIRAEMNKGRFIPLDFGYLENSYHYNLVRQDESFIELHSVFDPVDPESGFHYAEYQHELEGRYKDKHYMGSPSYFQRARHGHPVDPHHRHGYRGDMHFLLKGVQASESMMWTMIETDYLSLFMGGIR